MKKQISTPKIFAFCLGDFSRAVINGLIVTYALKFFNVTESSGLPLLLPIGAMGVIRMVGLIFDAVTDPWVASISDRSTNKNGKRIPFIRWAAIPYALTCLMMFFPPNPTVSTLNVVWVVVMILLYYMASTLYCVPYQALQAELTSDTRRRVFFYTINSLMFVIGSAVIYVHPVLVNLFKAQGLETVWAWRAAFSVFAVLGGICAVIPGFVIREKDYVEGRSYHEPILKSFAQTVKVRQFRIVALGYLVMQSGFAFFNAAMLFYIDVLLNLNEAFATIVLGISIVFGVCTYPLVNLIARKIGKKPLLIVACLIYVVVYAGIFFYQPISAFFGTAPVTSAFILSFAGQGALVGDVVCAFLIGLLIAFPIACTNILPASAFADLAQYDAIKTGENKTGMFIAARSFAFKVSSAVVVWIVSSVMYFGATDNYPTVLGVRLTAIIAAALLGMAAVIYARYDDKTIVSTIDAHNRNKQAEAPATETA